MAPKKLNLFDATMLVMGGIIGVGIFFNPRAIAALVPHPLAFLAMWVIGGMVALCGALTFAELGASFPRAGGWYVFLREAFGRFPAFLFAWIVLGVVSTGAIAVMIAICTQNLAGLVPGIASALDGTRTPSQTVAGVVILCTVTGVTLCGIKAGVWFQNACMLIKLAAIAALCLGAWFWFTPTRPVMEAPAIAPGALARGMVAALLPVLFACGGWQMVCYIAPQVKDPKTTLPRAIVLGVIGVVCVYLAINTAYLRVLGIEALATTPNFASEVARATLGPVGGEVLRAAMGISALGVCIVTVVATPFLYVAMAREGLFFERFGVLHPKTGAPTAALLAQLVFALAYWLWGQAELLVDSVVFVEWFFHGLVAIALIRLRRTRPELPRPFKSPLYPLAPLVYILVAIAAVAGNIALAISSGNLRAIWIGGAVLLLGALLYVPWTRWVAHSRAGPPSSA